LAEAKKEAGTVTAELVLTLPAVLLVIALAVGVMSIQLQRIQLVSAASEIARAIAREEPMAVVDGLVSDLGEQVGFEFLEEQGLICVVLKSGIELLDFDLTGLELSETQCAKAQGR
jgi:hypothetical protein